MIGVFDSGSGGLTVLKAIRTRFPNADLLYLGDTKNAPYGTKSQAQLYKLTSDAIIWLLNHHADHIVSACNSVSTTVMDPIFATFDKSKTLITEMVQPTVLAVAAEHPTRVAIAATPATITSNMYQTEYQKHGINIVPIAEPRLAPALDFQAPQPEVDAIVDSIIQKTLQAHCHTLVLSCTHFPLVAPRFEWFIKQHQADITLINPSQAVAESLPSSVGQGYGQTHLHITAPATGFSHWAGVLFPGVQVHQ